jgi:hypothetical protein
MFIGMTATLSIMFVRSIGNKYFGLQNGILDSSAIL